MNEILEDVAQDVLAISRIDAVPALLQFICRSTGMSFAAVARVTDSSWTACAVQDNIRFGLATGESLDVHSTLCKEARLGARLRTTSSRMAKLIDDVMDFARSRLGTGIGVSIAIESNMAGALLEVVDELRHVHPDREIQADVQIPQPLRCDRGRLQQLLSNLIGNALTYGAPDTPVVVSAGLCGDSLVLTVTNGGEPIQPENLSKVFQPYWRPNTSKPGGGLGLGLYICTEIAKAHGGNMEVASSFATGTVFGTRLPIVVKALK